MNKLVSISMILATVILTGCNENQTSSIPAIDGYKLVWSDEFDGNKIDSSNWTHEVGDKWHNNEMQSYTDRAENSYVKDGNLVIVAHREEYHGNKYTSARIRTKGKRDFKYGRMEARMKLPASPGMWPAFWMMPTDDVYGTWAASGEIDIMEALNWMEKAGGNLHFGGEHPENTSYGSRWHSIGVNFSEDFHTYYIEWEPEEFRWYIDGQKYMTVKNWWTGSKEDNGTFPAPFDENFHFLLNLAVGGWPGPPNEETVWPAYFYIDYVRVYQKTE